MEEGKEDPRNRKRPRNCSEERPLGETVRGAQRQILSFGKETTGDVSFHRCSIDDGRDRASLHLKNHERGDASEVPDTLVIQYSGSKDPSKHVKAYHSWMQIQTATDAMMCRGFSITLTGSAQSWYRQLKPNSISSFVELSRLFLTQFISGKRSRKRNTHLFAIKQEPKESLKDYIAYFNEEALLIEDYDYKMTLATVFNGLKEGKFTFSIGKNPPKTLAELIARAQKYTNAEEFSNARKNVQVTEPNSKGKRHRNEESQSSNKGPDDHAPHDRRPNRRLEGKFRSYTPLNTSTEQILLDIRGKKLLNWPVCMRVDPDHRNKQKYYCFH
ncbi:uncharacterized protein LOC131224131 [Magnolia sinica]|uniref:uncharacterized protein LOC131224131 n=1 Tax=Magnolia sinica TaxID=86752 RepID=UPI00265843F5|nr:uncharacterized protein LOC131224131 [Magnolia sinica]